MTIGLLKEPSHETRVSLLSEAVATLTKKGITVFVEKGAGEKAFNNDTEYEKAAALIAGDAPRLLTRAWAALAALDEWTPEATEAAVRGVAETAGVKLGQVAQPLRAALTGRTTSPGIFDVLALLGREESLARIADRMSDGDE